MFIARRDLWFARGRFALTGAVVALLALLIVLLTGLASGLVQDNIGGVRVLPASHIAFNAEAGVKWNRSTVDQTQWEGLGRVPGVRAATPLGNTLFNGQAYRERRQADEARGEILAEGTSRTKGIAIDLSLFGVLPDSFVAPRPSSGEALGGRADGVLISGALATKGVQVGDTIVLDRVGTELTVVGVTDKANYGHVPIVYAPLPLWQEATFGPPGGPTDATPLPPSVHRLATVVAVDADPGADVTTADAALGLKTVTRLTSYSGSPGYSEETGTLLMIVAFLYVIGAVLVSAFFTVWTIQRRHEIGLVKALGAGNRYLLKDALAQALTILVLATGAGTLAGTSFGFLIPGGAPFALEARYVVGSAVLIIAFGLLGAGLAVVRITRVDPLIALGGAR